MSPARLAWRSLTRQPARALLAIGGVTAVGALLFDMLLLSRGLVVSFRDLLDSAGFDVRVTATPAFPGTGPDLDRGDELARRIEALDEVEEAVAVRLLDAVVIGGSPSRTPAPTAKRDVTLVGTRAATRRTWELALGTEPDPRARVPEIVISDDMADELGLVPGDVLVLRADRGVPSIDRGAAFRVSGVAEFLFVTPGWWTAATTLDALDALEPTNREGRADFLLVASARGSDAEAAVAAIRALRPDLHTFSNAQFVARLEAADFSYFRQIAFVLGAITLGFAFLLVTTLLTVSVNQRLAEVAALRALGFPRHRVAADLVWESTWIVGTGGLLALPVGAALAVWLDGILKTMPVLERVHFFVFEPRAVVLHVSLLAATGVLATAWPVWLAARVPIAATLRKETVS
jgi:putative ABC transport system permease protein